MRKFIYLSTPKLTPSVGSSCFKTFNKKLLLYVVFIVMNIAESQRQLGVLLLVGTEDYQCLIKYYSHQWVSWLHFEENFGRHAEYAFKIWGWLTHADGGQCSRIKHT